MSKTMVPSPPLPTGTTKDDTAAKAREVKSAQSPLDEAFIGRVYRSMLWFGAVITLLVALGLRDAAAVSSLVAGIVLAAVLLRSQEIGVRSLMRPSQQGAGIDPKLSMLLLLPIKFIGVVVALATLNYFKLIAPAYVAAGFFVGQLVLVAKIAGWVLTRNAKK